MRTLMLGPPVEGDNFFRRDVQIGRLWTLLGTGHDVLLLDPRRVGKTSVLRRMQVEANRVATAYATFEGAADELAVFLGLYAAAGAANTQVAASLRRGQLARHADRILKLGALGLSVDRAGGHSPTWRQVAAEFLDALAASGENWTLLTDELPVFLRRLADTDGGLVRVEALLAWLRACRQDRTIRVRWVFAGSIGLDTLARRWGMIEPISDLRTEHLGPLSETDARQFVKWAADCLKLPLPDPVISELIERVGWPIPYHLALVIQAIHDEGISVSDGSVSRAIDRLLERAHRKDFETWDERLDHQLAKVDAALARALLTRCCRDPRGCSIPHARVALYRQSDADFDARFAFVTDTLMADGYVVQQGSRLLFRSPLLRAWWAAHGRAK